MDNYETREHVEIDVKHLFQTVWENLWQVILSIVLVAGITLGYAIFFVTPTYSSSVQLYVNNQYADSPGYSSSQIMAAQNLANTYMVILESRSVLEEVNSTAGLNYSYSQLKGMVSAVAVNETEVFTVTVVSADPHHAYLLANAVAEVLPDRISAVVDGSSVRVIDYAVESNARIAPSYPRYAILGAVIGMVMSVIVILVMDVLDTSIHSETYLSEVYSEIPLLAVVPGPESGKSGGKGYYEAAQKNRTGKKTGGTK